MLLEQVAYPKGIQNPAGTGEQVWEDLLAALDREWEISGLNREEFIDLGYYS